MKPQDGVVEETLEITCWEATPAAQGCEEAGPGEDRQPFSDFSVRIIEELIKYAESRAYQKGPMA